MQVLILGSGSFPWRRKWQPTPVLLSGEPHGQRILVGYSPGSLSYKESGTTEVTEHAMILGPGKNSGCGMGLSNYYIIGSRRFFKKSEAQLQITSIDDWVRQAAPI